MDNVNSSPTLIIPTIPDGDCPKGTLVQVLNYIFQTYLGQATINIPGLGDVTPAEIANLQAADISLQSQINAIVGATRTGSSAVAAGDSSVAIAFSSAMPNSNYSINIEFFDTSTGATAAFSWAVMTGTKTQTGVTIRCVDIPATITTFNYTIRQII